MPGGQGNVVKEDREIDGSMAVFPCELVRGKEQLRAEEENFRLYILERKAVEKPSHKTGEPEGSQLGYFLHNIQALYLGRAMRSSSQCESKLCSSHSWSC